jgi:hypothetical protein
MRAAYYEAFGGPENVQIGERPDPVHDAASTCWYGSTLLGWVSGTLGF